MEDQSTVDRIKGKRAAIQQRAEVHKRQAEERKKVADQTKAEYQAAKKGPVIKDLLNKCALFKSYHLKLAQDARGTRKTGVDEKGMPILEDYFLSNSERASHLDKASGIQEIIDYVSRLIADPVPTPAPVTATPEPKPEAEDPAPTA